MLHWEALCCEFEGSFDQRLSLAVRKRPLSNEAGRTAVPSCATSSAKVECSNFTSYLSMSMAAQYSVLTEADLLNIDTEV